MYTVLRQNVDRTINAEQIKQLAEFRDLEAGGNDPETGEPFRDADSLLESFLARNLPAPNEILYGFPHEGQPIFQGTRDPRLENSEAFTQTVARLRPVGGNEEITVNGTVYRMTVQPVRDDEGFAAFVVVHNVTESYASVNRLIGTYSVVAVLSWLTITALASLMAGRLLHPVRRLSETAHAISDGDLTRRITVTGNDDLTELQRSFNEMLDRLEASLTAQRQLLDDVGHELRTPLTILRGHLELLDTDNPVDTDSTRVLLLDETDRMSRLVSDLLILAKARRPDFVTFREENLNTLTMELYRKASALGDRVWRLDETAVGASLVDGQRVTQAMMQLVENAVRHTDTEDEIAIGSQHRGDQLEFWVRDTGVGVAPSDRDRIFSRFSRGSNENEKDEGFGLGLSIVSAIATAHGGSASLDNTAKGATFRLVIPATQPQGNRKE